MIDQIFEVAVIGYGPSAASHGAPPCRWFIADWRQLPVIDWSLPSVVGGSEVDFMHQPTMKEMYGRVVRAEPTAELDPATRRSRRGGREWRQQPGASLDRRRAARFRLRGRLAGDRRVGCSGGCGLLRYGAADHHRGGRDARRAILPVLGVHATARGERERGGTRERGTCRRYACVVDAARPSGHGASQDLQLPLPPRRRLALRPSAHRGRCRTGSP